ncbi:MAG TPA: hypothetical protein PLC65_03195 [Bacteroidia bacterium]|nr:hypothetical protein [Bacteroidia bacterium]
MKTFIKISVVLAMLSATLNAQVKTGYPKGGPKPGTMVPHAQTNSNNHTTSTNVENDKWIHGHWGPHGYGNITIGFGSYPYGQPMPYYNNYSPYHSAKKAAKYSIRGAGHMINEAVAFNTWHDIYSPLLAKAIRHYNFARQQYWWGNYSAAYNHAERANYLAWYSLQYFQNPGYYDDYNGNGYQPNPYSDPYNPYYKQGQGSTNNNGERKGTDVPKNESIDSSLPQENVTDKELIRTFDKSDLKDE